MEKEILEGLFIKAGKVIIELSDEADKIKIKFGESSKLYTSRIEQIQTLKSFYEYCPKYINDLNHTIRLQDMSNSLLCDMMTQHELMLSWGQIINIHGFDSEKAKLADEALETCFKTFARILTDGKEGA